MPVEIRPVLDGRDARLFSRFAEGHYRNTPMRPRSVMAEISPKHPYFRRAEGQAFLAIEDGKVVGRVMAALDHRRFEEGVGLVGLYEAVDDLEVATNLLGVSEDWLSVRGCRAAQGPLDPSAIVSGGILIEGFETPNPERCAPGMSYYHDQWKAAGWLDLMELYTWEVGRNPIPKQVRQIARVVEQRKDLKVRKLEISHIERELDLITMLYNAAWSSSWGYVPADREDIRAYISPDSLDLDVSRIAFINDRPAAIALVLPNRTPPSNVGAGEKFRSLVMHPDSFRVLLFGVAPEYRGHAIGGLSIHLYVRVLHAARMAGYKTGEATYTSALDEIPNGGMPLLGATMRHTYQVMKKNF